MVLSKEHNVYECWLRLAPVEDHVKRKEYQSWCSNLVIAADQSEVLETAARELTAGIQSLLGSTIARSGENQQSPVICLGVMGYMEDNDASIDPQVSGTLQDEGYIIQTVDLLSRKDILLAGKSDKGALYAVFHFLRLLQSGESLNDLHIIENPKNGLRMINHWDNMNGSIERGYAGKTIFYHNNQVVTDMTRIRDYARLLASIGINAISINNVNVHEVESRLITEALLPDVARIAAIFWPRPTCTASVV